MSDTSLEPGLHRLKAEDTVNVANAMIYLLSTALMYELSMADSHKERQESTNCGLTCLEADLRDSLSKIIQ